MMKNFKNKLFSGVLAFMLLFVLFCVPVAASEDTVTTTAKKGVARVVVEDADGNFYTGSAFGIGTTGEETDTFVTNRHVVTTQNDSGLYSPIEHVWLMPENYSFTISTLYAYDNEGNVIASETEDTDLNTDNLIECEILHYSTENDFAVIKASESTGRIALTLASSAKDAHEGDDIKTLGYPTISDSFSRTGEAIGQTNTGYPIYRVKETYSGSIDKITVNGGVISMFNEMTSENNTKIIQYDANISGGNSGGPLIDASNGNVLGINTWSLNGTESSNSAVDIDYVIEYLDQAGIPYDKANGTSIPWIPIIIVLAVVVIAVIAVFVIMNMRKQAGTAKAAYRPNPAQAPTSANTSGHQFTASAQGGNKQVRYCPYCGSPLNGDAKFCGNCGKKLS